MKILAILAMVMVLFTCLADPVSAGIEPSPWQPQINQLNSVVNNLSGINGRVIDIYVRFGVEPSPWRFNGAVGELNAMTNQLDVLQDRVQAIINMLGSEKGDQGVINSLMDVQSKAQAVVVSATSTEPLQQDVMSALNQVATEANNIAVTVNNFLLGH